MALGGTIRGKTTTLRRPTEADLETYNRWMADMRVRRAHSVWHEPAMPATWKERFKETAKEKMDVLASEAVRLRTGFAWRQLRMHRVHNWIALANRGSRRANEKSGYKQMGLYRKSWFRSGEWYDERLGEAYPHTFPEQR